MLAAGVLQEFYARRIRVPEGLSLIGFDNTYATYLAPPLTTVEQPTHDMGCAAARLALDLGYDTRLTIVKASDAAPGRKVLELLEAGAAVVSNSGKGARPADCVPVLVWPGPRVRNELRIFEEIAERRRRGVNTGLSIHADRLPHFLVEYLLRAFSLHNR